MSSCIRGSPPQRANPLGHGIPIIMDNYNRTKRGLIDSIGQSSWMLFGTAINKGVLELREKSNHLASFASAQNKPIHLKSQNIKRPEQHIQGIVSYTNILRFSQNAMLTNIKSLYSGNVLEQTLETLQNVVNLLFYTNSLIGQNIVEEDRGRAISSPVPVKDFLKTLYLGKNEYQLTFLFDINATYHYYSL